MPWLDELKIEDMRGDYAELAAVIGLEATVQVAEELGGIPLILPHLPELRHPDQLRSGYLDLHSVIGLELTAQVAAALGGGQLYLPKADYLLLEAKSRYVLANDKTHNRRLLARETKLSLRQIYRICGTQPKKRSREEDPRQLSLLPNTG